MAFDDICFNETLAKSLVSLPSTTAEGREIDDDTA